MMFAGALLEKQIVVVCSNLVQNVPHSLFSFTLFVWWKNNFSNSLFLSVA